MWCTVRVVFYERQLGSQKNLKYIVKMYIMIKNIKRLEQSFKFIDQKSRKPNFGHKLFRALNFARTISFTNSLNT
jgi:hypothetical protein